MLHGIWSYIILIFINNIGIWNYIILHISVENSEHAGNQVFENKVYTLLTEITLVYTQKDNTLKNKLLILKAGGS
jgi:hypothetical protein